jgi:ornithine cyclodeaminase/alanine dehydrogenase-like protein (mu-crystallin family)
MSGLDILFLSKEDVDAVDLGLDETMDAVEMGLRAHGEKKVVMPSKDHLALDRSPRAAGAAKPRAPEARPDPMSLSTVAAPT